MQEVFKMVGKLVGVGEELGIKANISIELNEAT